MTATPTIHLAVVRLMRPILGDVDIISWSIARDDPDSRRNALYAINAAWAMLAFAFLVAILVVAILVQALAGDRAGNVVVSIVMVRASSVSLAVRMCCGVGTGICPRRGGGFGRVIVRRTRRPCGGRCRATAASSCSPWSGS
jgi:hypothetical protein